ncbi:RNA 2',3'-cyclic phosphodiesterase [Bacillus smithii]|uniref:RNA 2',3'-cyclic phosphodiesterase n=1 Tax=Bacillus smithii TaxID=1479 RepID=UPI002E1C10BD|nr:RNA 2',3'-cyclic phosphodiesterase [Bacillus smithii]
MVEVKTHYFFALRLPDETKEYLYSWRRQFSLPFKRWVHPNDYHITFAFLGDADPKLLQKAVDTVKRIVEKTPPFSVQIDSIGTFGRKESPRIFWAGTKQNNRLFDIQKQVFQAAKEAGFQLDSKPFRPHITLAKKWNGDISFTDATGFLYAKPPSHIFQADSVVLYQTHLDRSPMYEEIVRFCFENKEGKESKGNGSVN